MSRNELSQRLRVKLAIETFVRGFCFTRSRTHPYVATKFKDIWRLHDSDRKNATQYRREEWVCFNHEPATVDRLARLNSRGSFVVCAFRELVDPLERLRDEFKTLGYRLLGTEPLFTHQLKRIPVVDTFASVKRIRTEAEALQLGRAMRAKPLSVNEISAGGPVRQYAAMFDAKVVGWVSSVAAGKRAWCSNLFVEHSMRRRGIGSALMATMLRDDREARVEASELLASHSGAKLYPALGYEQIGELLLLSPKKQRV